MSDPFEGRGLRGLEGYTYEERGLRGLEGHRFAGVSREPGRVFFHAFGVNTSGVVYRDLKGSVSEWEAFGSTFRKLLGRIVESVERKHEGLWFIHTKDCWVCVILSPQGTWEACLGLPGGFSYREV